jgi:hypothetical protein
MGVRPFESLQLLAPAIRTDLFHEKLAARIGRDRSIRQLTMFTMARDWEEDDNVAKVYKKSLLYLIFHALERDDETPILGLEESVRGDDALVRLFGLDGAAAAAQVVWSVTNETTGRSASTSSTHGGFDNDRPTMNSVATRILQAEPTVTFPDEAIERARAALKVAMEEPPPAPPSMGATSPNGSIPPIPPMPTSATTGSFSAVHPNGAGARRAICIGINAYASAPLNGCVADAQQWLRMRDALRSAGPAIRDHRFLGRPDRPEPLR